MKKIALISAMIEEIQPIIDTYHLTIISKINQQNVYFFTNHNLEIYLFNTGVGKTNASLTTALAIKQFAFDLIINIGTSGSIDPNVKVGEFVCATQLAFYDVDATAFGYELGQIPKTPLYQNIDSSVFLNFLKPLNLPIHQGLVLTGDSFINNKTLSKIDINYFDHPLCVEMESMAIVYVAHQLQKPIYVLRTISDNAYIDSNIEFKTYLHQVSQQYLLIFNHLVNNYEMLF